MQALSRAPGCPIRHKSSASLCLPKHVAHPAKLVVLHLSGTSSRNVQAFGFFDNLKKRLTSSDDSKSQAPIPPDEEDDSFFSGLRKLILTGDASKAQGPLAAKDDGDDGEEGNEMMRLDSESGGLAEDQSVFGPLAVLLVGFMAEEVEQFRKFMLEMEADMVKIVPCSPSMMTGTLQQALESEFPQYQQPPLGTRRTVFLSGMVGVEVVEVIAAYKDAGMPPTVWAAAVPNNYGRVVKDLVEEVHADNAAMVRRKAEEARELQEPGEDGPQ